MPRRYHRLFVACLLVFALSVSLALFYGNPGPSVSNASASVPAEFEDTLVTKVGTPIGLAWTPDGRMLIARKNGEVRVFVNDTLLSQPAIDLDDSLCTTGERGLQDVAVHPNFSENGYVFLYYTFNKFGSCEEHSDDGPVNRLARYVLQEDNTIDLNSETIFFDTPQLYEDHHNGGDIAFGKDGNLYVSIGDGARQNEGWQSDPGYLMGKIVRLTADGGIPVDNPFTGADSARCHVNGVPPAGSPAGTKCQEVLSLGFRNPFRMGFDPNSESVRFYINDVGVNTWEEIDEGPVPGGDYGWNEMEGPCKRSSTTECDPPPEYVDPIHWYYHGDGGAAITGGAFVPNGLWPSEYDGAYFYARFVQGKLHYLQPGASGCRSCTPPTSNFHDVHFSDIERIMTLVFGPYENTQALYYTTQGNEVRRIVYTGSANRSPVAVAEAVPDAGEVPLTVQFDASGSTDPDGDPLAYAWDLDGDYGVDSTDVAPTHEYTSVGTYTIALTVADGNGGIDTTTVTIDAGNTPPVPQMLVPGPADTFAAGQKIVLSGSATDFQDGALGDQALTWEVRQHHNTHWHPFLEPTAGNDIEIITPGPEDLLAATNSYLEIILTATDSNGLSTTITRDLMPRKVTLTFESVPTGRTIVIEDTPFVAPVSRISWEGYGLQLNAPDQNGDGGVRWEWESWSHGAGQSHTLTVPAESATYTVTFGTDVPTATSTPGTPPASGTPAIETPTPGTPTPEPSATATAPAPGGQSDESFYFPILRR